MTVQDYSYEFTWILKGAVYFWPLIISDSGLNRTINLLNAKVIIIETSQLICSANQLAGFYMMATLTFNELHF